VKLSNSDIIRSHGQKWVMLTADDTQLDAPVVETSKGRMILVEVIQSLTTGAVWHQPVHLEFYQPKADP
jgi:hypothetical protein